MSLVSKLLVKLNPINILYTKNMVTPNIVSEMRRNISKRFTIGQDCQPEPEPGECPEACRKVKKPLPMSQACRDSKERARKHGKKHGKDRSEAESDYEDTSYRKKKRDHKIKGVKKPGKYTSAKCDPFPREEQQFRKKFLKCRANMRHPCDPPVPEHLCSLTTGKILYTTNERPVQKLPNTPKGNWKYTDRRNKMH